LPLPLLIYTRGAICGNSFTSSRVSGIESEMVTWGNSSFW